MNRRIVQTWKTEDLSEANPLFSISKKSWKTLNPHWKYDFYTDDSIDSYVSARLPKYHQKIFSRYQGQIERVDAFRLITMFFDAGLYCDLDGECLQPIDGVISHDGISLGQLKNKLTSNKYSNAWMYSSERHEQFWIYVLAESIRRFYTNRGYHSTEFLTGPVLLTDCVNKYHSSSLSEINHHINKFILDPVGSFSSKSRITLLPPEVIYPIDWSTMDESSRKQITQNRLQLGEKPSTLNDSSHCIHYWTHSWTPPLYSFRHRLFLRAKYIYRLHVLRQDLRELDCN